jgi:hypothetical protein
MPGTYQGLFSRNNLILMLGIVIASVIAIVAIINTGLYVLLNSETSMPFYDVIVGCTVGSFSVATIIMFLATKIFFKYNYKSET